MAQDRPRIFFSGFFEKFETFFGRICAHSERYRYLLAGIFEIPTFYGNIAFPLSPVLRGRFCSFLLTALLRSSHGICITSSLLLLLPRQYYFYCQYILLLTLATRLSTTAVHAFLFPEKKRVRRPWLFLPNTSRFNDVVW